MGEDRRKLFTLVATILGSTIVFLDGTVVNVALPAIADGLDAGLADQQWIVEAYMLATVSLLLVGGALGDQLGRRRVFIAGLVGFGLASALCAVAPTSEALVASRALQGLAGALLVPGSLAILTATFEGAERGKAIGTWTAWTGIATVFGPAGGGALVEALSWRAIFWVNIPLIVACVLLARTCVRESVDPEADPSIDWAGIGLSALGLGGPVFALIEQPRYGWGDPIVWVPLVAGVVLFGLFLLWESRYPRAMLDLSLFRIRNFAITNLETLIVYAGLLGAFFFITLFLQQTAGYTALEAGFATTPISLLLFLLSPRFGRFATGIGPRLPMCVGPIVGGAGLLLLTRVDAGADYLSEVLPGVIVFGLGLSATVAPLTATALNSVAERHAGIASGINNGVSRMAGLLAIAVLGALIGGSFGSSMDEAIADGRLSADGREALERAKADPFVPPGTAGLPSGEADAVEAAATEGAESAFHLGIGISGALMIVGGVVAGVGIQNPRRGEDWIAPRAAPAGECARCDEAGHSGEHHRHEREPATATG